VDLARTVAQGLPERLRPSTKVLTELFEVVYFASHATEEGHPILCQVTFLDPRSPDPKPPERIRRGRWQYIALNEPIRLTQLSLVKAARATDPRASSFVVYPDRYGRLYIWGLVDQGTMNNDFLNYDSDTGQDRAGVFLTSIEGIGHLSVFRQFTKIAELANGRISRRPLDVLHSGPVRARLEPAITDYIAKVWQNVPTELYDARDDWDDTLESLWLNSLSRLLLRCRGHRHGGALIITPELSRQHLNVGTP
jgi:hypothetical protein